MSKVGFIVVPMTKQYAHSCNELFVFMSSLY